MTFDELAAFVGPAQPVCAAVCVTIYRLTSWQSPYSDGPFMLHLTPYSPSAAMTCVPMRDSPGTLSAKMLDLTDFNTAMLYLTSMMDDACLQVWSNSYAECFWHGIIAVIDIEREAQRSPRWTARGLLLTSTIHFGFQSYGWARLSLVKFEWAVDDCPPTGAAVVLSYRKPANDILGMAAYAFVLWMNLSTLNCFRRFILRVLRPATYPHLHRLHPCHHVSHP